MSHGILALLAIGIVSGSIIFGGSAFSMEMTKIGPGNAPEPAYEVPAAASTRYVAGGYINTFGNGTHVATLGPSSIQNGTDSRGNPTYGPYVFSQNGTGYLVQTGDGSLYFDKSRCTGYFYKAGIINGTNDSPMVSHDSFFMLQKNQTSSWAVENQVTNKTCTTSIIRDPKYVEIDATRDDPSLGSITVKYTKSYGGPFVSVISAKNENPLWKNNDVALEERMSVPGDIVFNETKHDLSSLKNLDLSHRQLESFYHKDIDFEPSPYALLLDKAMYSFSNMSFSFDPDSKLVNVVIDYTRNPSAVAPGHSFTVDPTLAYSTGTQWDFNSQYNNPTSHCYDTGPTANATTASATNTIIYQTSAAYCEGRVLRVDISSIPANSAINSVNFQYNVSALYSTPPTCALVDIMDDPSTVSRDTIWSDMYGGVNGKTNNYRQEHLSVTGDSQCDTVGNAHTDTLAPSVGIADLETQLYNGEKFFAVAMTFNTTGLNSYVTYPYVNGFRMDVSYNSSIPSPPTDLTATAASTSQINLSWVAGYTQGLPTGYKIERSTDGGSTWSTLVADTGSTSTTYSDTGLAAATTYQYRVSGINSVGTSSPSNVASATTDPVSSDTRLESSGEQRTSYFNGTSDYEFYYNGTSSSIFYMSSSDGGRTWSDPASTTSGALAGSSYFGVYGNGSIVVLSYANTTDVLTEQGTISGSGPITWSPPVAVTAVSGSEAGQEYYPSFSQVGSTLFLEFNVDTDSGGVTGNYGYVYVSDNMGGSWTSQSANPLYSGQTYPAAVGIARYGDTDAIAVFAEYGSTEFNYTTFDGTWSGIGSTSGAGLAANSSKTQGFSMTSNGTCAWAGYVAGSGGNPTTIAYCGNFTSPQTLSAGTALYPTISAIGNNIYLFYVNSTTGTIERVVNTGYGWGPAAYPFGSSFSSPAFLHAEKYGHSGYDIPVEWREGSSSPFTIRFDITGEQWGSAGGYLVSTNDTDFQKQSENSVTFYEPNSSTVIDNVLNFTYNGGEHPYQCQIYNSTDGGVTWQKNFFQFPFQNDNTTESDPVVAASKNGTIYASCLENTNGVSSLAIYNSTNGGNDWNLNRTISFDSFTQPDKDWLAIDRSSSFTSGYVYTCWTNHTRSIQFERINPFDPTVQTLSNGTNSYLASGCDIAIGPQGQVYVSWMNDTSSSSQNGTIEIIRNFNNGTGNWTPVSDVARYTRTSVNSCGEPDCIQGYMGSYIFALQLPSMDVGPAGTIHLVFQSNSSNTKHDDIYYVQSSNCGSGGSCTFSTPVKIDLASNSINLDADHFEPELVVSTKTVPPTLHVLALDRRNDPNNLAWRPYDYSCNLFFDCTKQANWSNNPIVLSSSENLDAQSQIGEYQGITFSNTEEAYSAWIDHRDTSPYHRDNYDVYGDGILP